MRATFYILCIFILFTSTTIASEDDWVGGYPERGKRYLFEILTNKFTADIKNVTRYVTGFVSRTENIKDTREVLWVASKSPFDLYNTLLEPYFPPEQAKLAMEYYIEQRKLSKVSEDFGEFDVHFCFNLLAMQKTMAKVRWNKLGELSSKKEVICEAAFFHRLIDFERAITCLDDASSVPLTCKLFSPFVADMYFGEASRVDFTFEGDIETRKWLDDMIKKYGKSHPQQTSSLMRRCTRNIRDKIIDKKLWTNYMRAMMTVHLSSVMIAINIDGLKDMYNYLAENDITDEYMFASEIENSKVSHAHLRTFKFDPFSETATMGVINSGYGIEPHDNTSFKLSALPGTLPKDPHAKSVTRYIPFIVYDAVPMSDWGPVYAIVDTIHKAYFEHKQKKHVFDNYQRWQYIDDQRGGTCAAMSLWSALYWFERESQQNLESFRLALYLEMLKEAAKELIKLRTELKELGDQIFEMSDNDPGRDELQLRINEKSETEDDFLRFFSVGFNSAIRSIRYLHTDPFGQKLDMSAVMQKYVAFYESQAGERYWKLVKPNIDSLYNSTYLRILNPTYTLPSVTPTISIKERDCVNEVNQAVKVKNPFNFVKAVIRGTDLKCQSKTFLESVQSGINALVLQTHHQDLILRALAKEIRSLRGGRLPILRFIVKLINDHNFKLLSSYDVPKNASINFIENSHQVVMFDDDAGMKQFAANCTAFDSLAKNVLAAAYDLVKSAMESLSHIETRVSIEDTEEYKLHENLVQSVVNELQSIDPHLYARYLGDLLANAGQAGIINRLYSFKPSERWDQDDYDLLENVAQKMGQHKRHINQYIVYSINYSLGLRIASSHPHVSVPNDLPAMEYVCAANVSHAINMDSPLDFTKVIASEIEATCQSELFFSLITHGIESLELQTWHRDLILRIFAMNCNIQTIKFINKLITDYNFKLFPTNNTPRTRIVPFEDLFDQISRLGGDTEAQQLVADLNEYSLPASRLLYSSSTDDELLKYRSNFVDRVFIELQSMNPRLHAYYLGILIRQKALKPKDFASPAFKSFEEWDHYDYVLIGDAIPPDQQAEFDKIFTFPKEYQIDTSNARGIWEFFRMSPNPSQETLRDFAEMLFKMRKGA